MSERQATHPQAAPRKDTTPYWSDSADPPQFPRIARDQDVDVAIVGGGITGLTAAYLLTQAGKTVVVLERGRCADVDTGHTTAHLTMVTDSRLPALVKRFGREHAQAAWDAGLAAISQIDAIVRDQQIDCEFEWVDGYIHSPPGGTADESAAFEDEARLAVELGFDATLVRRIPFFEVPGICFDGQARFHPRKYLAGLARAIIAAGGQIYERSEADEFSAEPLSINANGSTVSCGEIIIATHNPLVGLRGIASATVFQTKLALYTSYAIAGRVARGAIADALFWDTADPYHYLRVDTDGDEDVVIFGGEDHKTGQAANTMECYRRLEHTLTGMLPSVQLTHRWSGQVIETADGLPYIGRTADHQYAATGFSGNGMTFGTLGAMIMTDAILGRRNPWTDLFDPGRAALLRGAWDYVKENTDYPYYMIRDRFAGPEGRSLRSVKRGRGMVIEHAGQKVAAYRDESGTTVLRSAICTHMGCLVGWNDAERTWDCPCHGSRFKPNGEVISGPAESPLSKVG